MVGGTTTGRANQHRDAKDTVLLNNQKHTEAARFEITRPKKKKISVVRLRTDPYRPCWRRLMGAARICTKKWLRVENSRENHHLLPTSVRQKRPLS